MRKILCLAFLLTLPLFAQEPYHGIPPAAATWLSSNGTLAGPWNPLTAAAGTDPYIGTPRAAGIYYSSTGTQAGPWYPCTLAACFGGGSTITLTTASTSGLATLTGTVLNIPHYAGSGANADITSLTGLTTPLPVSEGGTGTTTPALTAGTGCSGFTGTWPNITVNCAGTGGAVASVSNSDGTLTVTPTTGVVVASLNLAHANTWTGQQTFVAPVLGTPASGLATNLTGLPAASVVAGALANGMTATTQSANDGSTDLATTRYVDTGINNAIAGVNPAVAVLAASTASVTGTYAQVGGGIGDTFTVTATGAFTLDGVAINTIGQRVLLKNQATASQNGVYTATVVGASLVSPVFTRALDYDTPSDVNNTGSIPVQSGTANALTSWLLTSQVTSIGSSGSSLTYAQFSYGTSIPLSALAVQAADTVVQNATNSSAAPTAVAMPSGCTTGVNYSTATHTWTCPSSGGLVDPTSINLSLTPYYASAAGATTTTGNFSASATSGTVASCSTFLANNGVLIVGGASGGWTGTDYIGTVVSCTGTTLTITPAITNAVSSHVVQHDETAAFVAALAALNDVAGGTILLPNLSATTQGVYLVNGALQNTGTANAILQMPTSTLGYAGINITIQGFTKWLSSPIIQTSLNTSGASLFGGYGTVSPHLTGVGLQFKDVQVFGPTSGSETLINGTNLQALNFEGSVRVQGATTGIATTGNGVLFPSIGNNVALYISGLLAIQGFGTAVRLGEHSAGLDILVANSTNGVVFDVAPGGAFGDTTPNSISVSHIWCGPPSSSGGSTTVTNCLVGGSQATSIAVADVDYEGTGGTLVSDPSNFLHGTVSYALNNTASCPTSPTISGATNLAFTSLNCVPGGQQAVATGTPASGDIAAFGGPSSVSTATAAQVNTLLKTLSGCNVPTNVYVPQGGSCVAPSGSSGGMTNITSSVTFSGSATCTNSGGQCVVGTPGTTWTFSTIPGSYRKLLILLTAANSSSASLCPTLIWNGDTTSPHYQTQSLYGSQTSAAGTQSAGSANGTAGCITGTNITNDAGQIEIDVDLYAGTTFNKKAIVQSFRYDNSTVTTFQTHAINWTNGGTPAAITSGTLTLSGGNFVAGSSMSVYGIQ